jgi:hypothetical protein
MKNKQNIKSFFVHVLFATICFNLNVVQAQVHNGAELYIDNSILHIDSGSFNFGSGTITTRDYIKLRSIIYGDGASWIGASTKRFVDGYVQTRSTTAFVLPVGHSGFMRQFK